MCSSHSIPLSGGKYHQPFSFIKLIASEYFIVNATYKADISNDLADRGLHFIPAPAAGCGCSGACKAGDHDRVEPDHWGGCLNVTTTHPMTISTIIFQTAWSFASASRLKFLQDDFQTDSDWIFKINEFAYQTESQPIYWPIVFRVRSVCISLRFYKTCGQ